MQKKTGAFFLLLLILSFFGCSSRTESESRLYRFIDNLDEPNIVLSPLTQVPQNADDLKGMFPAESYSLMDLGSGNNPHGIKRKLMLKGREVNALYCPPQSIIRYKIMPRENSQSTKS